MLHETCNLNFAVFISHHLSLCLHFPLRSQSSVVSIVTGQWAGQLGVQIQVGARDFSLLQSIQSGPGAHLSLLFSEYQGLFSEIRLLGDEVNHSPPSSAEV